ncbi:MAG: ABC transporter ATP-binding protein [Thermoplasmatota archaeon]
MPAAVEARNLSRSFGDIVAVKGVSFTVPHGEVFAFLGPNGAGKSTTIKMLCTLLKATSGAALVGGHDAAREPRAVRRRIGLVFQERTLDDQLTAEENLRFHAVLYGVPRAEVGPRIDRVLALVGLSDRKKALVSTYSGGMARRLEVARALLHAPQVLFLDEPTVGLDPQTRAKLWADVLRLRREAGVTVFMTTHYMDEAEVADRIAIIDHGEIVATGTPAELKRSVGADMVRLKLAAMPNVAARAALERTFGAGNVSEKEGELCIRVKDGSRSLMPVLEIMHGAGLAVQATRVTTPNLDDVFLHYTGHEIRREDAAPSAMARVWMARGGRR